MGDMKFELINSSNGNKRMMSMPDDRQIKFIISKLIKDFSLGEYNENGELIVWEFYHPSSCKILSEKDTLKGAGVSENDTIYLTPKVQETVDSDLEPSIKRNVAVLNWEGDSAGSPCSFPIMGERAIIGRFDPDSGPVDIDLNCLPEEKSEYISRHHAEIWRDKTGQWFIKDLGSVNGTFYRIKLVTGDSPAKWIRVSGEQSLCDGYSIALGNVPFEFHVSDG